MATPPPPPSHSFHTVQLTSDPSDAPRVLRLKHAICLPCRSAGSRCEGHQNVTVSCIQCRKRGDACVWRLQRSTAAAAGVKRERQDTESEEDEEAGDLSDDSEGRREEKRVKKERSASVASVGKKGKLPVPSAGWPLKQDLSAPFVRSKHTKIKREDDKIIGKGKKRAKQEDETPGGPQEAEASGTSTDEAEESGSDNDVAKPSSPRTLRKDFGRIWRHTDGTPLNEEEQVSRLISHFESTYRGVDFLTTSSYESLLSSMFAQDSADLANSLHWWNTAKAGIQSGRTDPVTSSDEEWYKLTHLERLLAENAYTWDLWPRLPAYPDTEVGTSRSLHSIATRGPAIDMEPNISEEIAGIALRQLADSTLFDDINESISPLHMEALISNHTKHGFPFRRSRKRTVQHPRSTYALPEISLSDYRRKYLNREDMILDQVEDIRVPLIRDTLATLDGVLMNIAKFRKVQSVRRHRVLPKIPVEEPAEAGEEQEEMSEVKKGKQRAVNQDDALDVTMQEEPEQVEAEAEVKKQKKPRKKERQPPGDWKAVVLAAASTPGIPRSALKAAIDRLEAIHGPMGIDVMKRYDALNPVEKPPERPPDRQGRSGQDPLFRRLPGIPKARKRLGNRHKREKKPVQESQEQPLGIEAEEGDVDADG